MPRDDEEDDHAEELLLGEGVAAVLNLQERADEIVCGLRAPALEQLVQVGDELAHQRAELGERFGTQRGRHDSVRPAAEAVAIRERDAEQLRDHGDREREGIVVDEVHLAACLDRVDQLVGDLLHPRP